MQTQMVVEPTQDAGATVAVMQDAEEVVAVTETKVE